MSPALLEPDFLRTLEALRRRLASEARSGQAGEGAAPRRGGSAEFREHRAYVPGDDLRRVDWHAFARSGEPVLKLFAAEEDSVVRLLIDGSASLGFGTPSKLDVARRMAAAVAYLALAGGQRAEVLLGRNTPEGRALEPLAPPRRGRPAFAHVCRELESLEPSGRVDLHDAIEVVVRRSLRPGMLVVLSDFLDPGPAPSALTLARSRGHDVALIQILDPSELDPELDGDFSLEDAETGERVEITADPAALQAYARRLAGLFEELRRWAKSRNASYVRLRTTDDLEDAVRRLLRRSVD